MFYEFSSAPQCCINSLYLKMNSHCTLNTCNCDVAIIGMTEALGVLNWSMNWRGGGRRFMPTIRHLTGFISHLLSDAFKNAKSMEKNWERKGGTITVLHAFVHDLCQWQNQPEFYFTSLFINEDIIRRVLEIVTFLMLLQPTIFMSTKNACIVFEFLTLMLPLTVY